MDEQAAARPNVSVIMAVHNGASTIREALASLLDQTMPDFELVVVDDRSDDDTVAVLQRFRHDGRVVVHESPVRLGTARARNLAMQLASSDLIAVADADDISMPSRLEQQSDFLRMHPDVVAVGAQMTEFGDWGERLTAYHWPEDREAVRRAMLRGRMGVAHAAAMFRREAALAVGGYDVCCPRSEDLALFRKLASSPMAALPDPLVRYMTTRSIGIRYVWREMVCSVLAVQRNPIGAAASAGPTRLGPRGLTTALVWTARSWSLRRLRELRLRVPGRTSTSSTGSS